jgi:hypothetical protein
MNLDWMKSMQWLANVGHFLAGLGVVLLAALYSHDFETICIVTGALVAYGLVKEYVVDLIWESGETVASSTVDFVGYMLGAVVAWANLFGAHALGSW